MTSEVLEDRDPSVAQAATGVLRALNRAGVLRAADVHVASRLGRLGGETDERVLLAVALTVRAVRGGSVCLDLQAAAETLDGDPRDEGAEPEEPAGGDPAVDAPAGLLPDPEEWWTALERSPLLGTALQREGGLLYLDRYWREEGQVVDALRSRASVTPPVVDGAVLADALAAAFPDADSDDQRAAAETAVRSWTSVVTGGPGTGKTTTIARLLSVLRTLAEAEGRPLRIALAAPTGKAAARMTEALRAAGDPTGRGADGSGGEQPAATTLHRLLGWRPESRTRFRHDRGNPLPHDVVVVDETSMLSLTMTARLMEAVRPAARLVLVGDADQLASVEAGAVLTDLVEGYGARQDSPVVRLTRSRRFGEVIGLLADAIRDGDEDTVLAALRGGGPIRWLSPEEAAEGLEGALTDHAVALHRSAEAGDLDTALQVLDRHRLLCAHRSGPYGVARWNRRVQVLLQERLGRDWLPEWYAGRPFLVNGNDHGLQLFNGDSGVAGRDRDGSPVAALSGSSAAGDGHPGPRVLATTRLPDVSTAYATTVHRSQGSQFEAVTLLLPEPSSRILTRELLYTAVTRATTEVTVVGTEDAVRAAVSRRARRATGLAQRLA
jgi:exodeoxyribonuclease V alpha subunit